MAGAPGPIAEWMRQLAGLCAGPLAVWGGKEIDLGGAPLRAVDWFEGRLDLTFSDPRGDHRTVHRLSLWNPRGGGPGPGGFEVAEADRVVFAGEELGLEGAEVVASSGARRPRGAGPALRLGAAGSAPASLPEAAACAAGLQEMLPAELDAVAFWDWLPVRPGDEVFALRAAWAVGDRLDLMLAAAADPRDEGTVLSVWSPRELKLVGDKLHVTGAARIAWGDRQARVDGKQLVTEAGGQAQHRPLPPGPALVLG